mmetsp:Transcript_6680/g.14920  ORF Transcript_6680/g.14920 Transcript_6680/m.14920 type:complete len:397 (-) Transcript_6680:534-1724(-)
MNNTRRSGRERFRPLEYWANERVVYEQSEAGPVIVGVITHESRRAEPVRSTSLDIQGELGSDELSNIVICPGVEDGYERGRDRLVVLDGAQDAARSGINAGVEDPLVTWSMEAAQDATSPDREGAKLPLDCAADRCHLAVESGEKQSARQQQQQGEGTGLETLVVCSDQDGGSDAHGLQEHAQRLVWVDGGRDRERTIEGGACPVEAHKRSRLINGSRRWRHPEGSPLKRELVGRTQREHGQYSVNICDDGVEVGAVAPWAHGEGSRSIGRGQAAATGARAETEHALPRTAAEIAEVTGPSAAFSLVSDNSTPFRILACRRWGRGWQYQVTWGSLRDARWQGADELPADLIHDFLHGSVVHMSAEACIVTPSASQPQQSLQARERMGAEELSVYVD